ncbi:MAG TPA: MXAN_5187 C-terminal domain-containing protein [Thermoanaerobaculia bacterium]|nr:MXAN_5187 C-terminal domain-containing protein [Thermoanaerobaculia bacterium]
MTNDEALTQFEESLRKLKIQYHLFFSGIRKLPPSEDRRRLDNLVRELSQTRMRDNASRFRFNTMLGRYNQFQELWARQLREQEEGPLDYRRRMAALEAASDQAAASDAAGGASAGGALDDQAVTGGPGDSYVKVTGETTEAAAKRLYAQIAEAQKTLGKGGLSLAQVEHIVRSQTEVMRSRFSVEEVGFRVEVVDGKVKLKAKPFQKGS